MLYLLPYGPSVAKHLEENYRFHQPPHLVLNGNFAGRKEDRAKTIFSVAATTEGQTDHPFLGEDLPLQNLAADIVVRGAGITVKNLTCATLGGSISGSVSPAAARCTAPCGVAPVRRPRPGVSSGRPIVLLTSRATARAPVRAPWHSPSSRASRVVIKFG